MANSNELTHPAIREAVQTCSACPEQWEGVLQNGQHFYFRYRGGSAGLGIGADPIAALHDWRGKDDHIAYGDSLQGCFESDEARNLVFASLFAADQVLAALGIDWRA